MAALTVQFELCRVEECDGDVFHGVEDAQGSEEEPELGDRGLHDCGEDHTGAKEGAESESVDGNVLGRVGAVKEADVGDGLCNVVDV